MTPSLKPLALTCAIVLMPLKGAQAQTALCFDTVADLPAPPITTLRATAVDPGYLQYQCSDCPGLIAFELFVGVDVQSLDENLRSGAITIGGLRQECLAAVPACDIQPLASGDALGYAETSAHSGLQQIKYRIALDDSLITLRLTTTAPTTRDLLTITDTLWASLTTDLLPPC